MEKEPGYIAAVEEMRKGASEGGVPIGACLVSRNGEILGRGHNMRVQKGSPTLHAEMSALENAGRLPAAAFNGATMYTTLSPCDMCTGACILYKVKRVVIAENKNFVGGEKYLKERGIEVEVVNDENCIQFFETWVRENPTLWNEDISV